MLNIDADRDRSAPTLPPVAPTPAPAAAPAKEQKPDKKIKNRIESWLKDAEEDAEKAEMYLDKKKEMKGQTLSNNNKKASATELLPPATDVFKAMEAVEDASESREKANPRKKTPPGSTSEDRKRLIRELGRKPSEEKVSLYVRKPSNEPSEEASEASSEPQSTGDQNSRAKKFMDSMRRSMEVPADFLDTIKEEKGQDPNKPTPGQQIAKKYPFNRTTTPNSLREHLKETLTKTLGDSSHDIAETIEHFKNDEILDTFNIDNENVESPTLQRKQPRSLRAQSTDNLSETDQSDQFGSRRRNLKFRTLGSSGDKPLGDREIMLKKKNKTSADPQAEEADDLNAGLFDRFSAARKTLGRGSIRRANKKDEEDSKSLNDVSLEKKSSLTSDWRSRLAAKFKKSTDTYEVNNGEAGEPSLSSYRKTSNELDAPMTEPTRRRRTISNINDRKISHDYDSELVDGKYVTSVPIEANEGNLRPSHHREPPRGLKDLKSIKNPRDDLIQRLSSTSKAADSNSSRKAVSQGNVFDRLSSGPNSGSRSNLSSSGSIRRSAANSSNGTAALSKIKDLTKGLRKNSHDNEANDSTYVAPRNSLSLFQDQNKRSNLNASKSSINSSTRSLQKDSPKTTRRATTSTIGKSQISSSSSLTPASSIVSFSESKRTTPSRYVGSSTYNLRNGNSKEDLSRSSSSASNR